ncbi:MAG: biotin transporter BioY [Roseburia sp.]|nr:biotin transporter BioY [Roseburia sp.]MCM1243725.1 biotin transporter BioY [Roseburia sp.]
MKENVRQFTDKTVHEKKTGKTATKDIVCVGMFAAVLAVLAQISIPMPSGVPVTLQTFAVALTGVVLSWKLGTASILVYILLGAVGLPVFSGFKGGIQALAGYTGGFIWGFIALVFLCGIGMRMKNKIMSAALGFVGLAICHLLGVIQFMFLMKIGFTEAFLLVSAPYLLKDVVSVILADIMGMQIRARLKKSSSFSIIES